MGRMQFLLYDVRKNCMLSIGWMQLLFLNGYIAGPVDPHFDLDSLSCLIVFLYKSILRLTGSIFPFDLNGTREFSFLLLEIILNPLSLKHCESACFYRIIIIKGYIQKRN